MLPLIKNDTDITYQVVDVASFSKTKISNTKVAVFISGKHSMLSALGFRSWFQSSIIKSPLLDPRFVFDFVGRDFINMGCS